jgi:hypothetical protein
LAGFSAGEFDASFDLAKGHAGEMEGSSVNAVEPGDPSLQARGATLIVIDTDVLAYLLLRSSWGCHWSP